jgi:hypothetical protein
MRRCGAVNAVGAFECSGQIRTAAPTFPQVHVAGFANPGTETVTLVRQRHQRSRATGRLAASRGDAGDGANNVADADDACINGAERAESSELSGQLWWKYKTERHTRSDPAGVSPRKSLI